MDTDSILDQLKSSNIQTRTVAVERSIDFVRALWKASNEALVIEDGRSPVIERLLTLMSTGAAEIEAILPHASEDVRPYLGILLVQGGSEKGLPIVEETLRLGTLTFTLAAITLARHRVQESGPWILDRVRALDSSAEHEPVTTAQISTLLHALNL